MFKHSLLAESASFKGRETWALVRAVRPWTHHLPSLSLHLHEPGFGPSPLQAHNNFSAAHEAGVFVILVSQMGKLRLGEGH